MHMPSSKVKPPQSGFGDAEGYAQGWSRTIVSRRVGVCLSVLFCGGLLAVPVADGLLGSWREPALKAKDGFVRIIRCFSSQDLRWSAVVGANNEALATIKEFETSVEDSSAIAAALRPSALDYLLCMGRAGSEEAYVGRDGWLFYRPDVDALVMHTPGDNEAAAGIVDFAAQLAERGIRLVIVPVPGKASIHPEKLGANSAKFGSPPVSPVLDGLAKNVAVAWKDKSMGDPWLAPSILDPTALLWRRKLDTGKDQFLKTDSHWSPDAMRAVAEVVAKSVSRTDPSNATGTLSARSRDVSAIGDTALMLKLPKDSPLLARHAVTIEPIKDKAGKSWRPDRNSSVVVLGDSYTNIYSSEDLGWGGSAGFAEHLSRFLGYSIDKLARNDSGAKSARDMLRTEAARNPGWLDRKKVVVWVMAAREFVRGDWSHVNLEEGKAPVAGSRFFVVPPGQPREVEARIVSHGPLPVAGNSPYADYLTAVHLTDLQDAVSRQAIDGDALAYLCTMRDHRVISSPDMVEGAYIRLRLSNYEENADKLDPLNRGEIDDVEVMMEEPNFAEWTSP